MKTRQPLTQYLYKSVMIFTAVNSLRLDSKKSLYIWIPLIGVYCWLYSYFIQTPHVIEYVLVSWVFYYVGLSCIFIFGINRLLIEKLGEHRSYKIFEILCGAMFFNIGLGITAASFIDSSGEWKWTLVNFISAGILFVFGFGVKYWATWVVGEDSYFFKDLFLEKPGKPFERKGPYRWLSNPMYGAGNFHAYCPAIMAESLAGLLFAFFCHISIYVFYFAIERPFIRKVYSTPA